MTRTVLRDPAAPLARRCFDFLQPRSTRRERLARPGPLPPVRQRLVDPASGHDPAMWPHMPEGVLLTFVGDVAPVLCEPGRCLYRVVGDGSYPNGSFWMLERPASEDTMRRDYALLNDWNGDRGVVVLELARRVAAWQGRAASQRSSDRLGYLPGGAEQLWVPPGTLRPSHGRWALERL